jgi:hypothetical protein
MINRFNLMSGFVVKEILVTDKPEKRAKVIQRWIEIAKKCRELNNFNGVMEILAGLENSSIHRLKRSWRVSKLFSTNTSLGYPKKMDNDIY